MKMSRSIKDYKQAMDSIKISESFYAKNEVLLRGLPEKLTDELPGASSEKPSKTAADIRIYEKGSLQISRKITAVLMSAAACAVFVFGVRLAMENGRQDISTETVTETAGSYDMTTEAEADAAELIDRFEDDNFPVDITPEELPVSSDVPAADPTAESEPAKTEPPKTTERAEPPVTTKSVKSTDNKPVTATTAKTEKSDNSSVPASPTGENGDTNKNANPGAISYQPAYNGDEVDDGDYDIDDEAEDIDYDIADDSEDDAAGFDGVDSGDIKDFEPTVGAEEMTADDEPLFELPSLEAVTVTVTGNGGAVSKKGSECRELTDIIARLSDSPKTRDGVFTPLYTVNITENGSTLYTVYLTDMDTLVICRGAGGLQREAFALSVESSEQLKNMLQNMV